MMERIKGFLILFAVQPVAFGMAIAIHRWLRGQNDSDVGVAMYSNHAWAVLAGIVVIVCVGFATATSLQRTLLKGSSIALWAMALGLTFLACLLFGIGAAF